MIIRWNYESPLYIDQTIASLTDRLNKDKTDFNDVPIEKWEAISKIWMENNHGYVEYGGSIDTIVNLQKKAALKLVDDYSVSWDRRYNVF